MQLNTMEAHRPDYFEARSQTVSTHSEWASAARAAGPSSSESLSSLIAVFTSLSYTKSVFVEISCSSEARRLFTPSRAAMSVLCTHLFLCAEIWRFFHWLMENPIFNSSECMWIFVLVKAFEMYFRCIEQQQQKSPLI